MGFHFSSYPSETATIGGGILVLPINHFKKELYQYGNSNMFALISHSRKNINPLSNQLWLMRNLYKKVENEGVSDMEKANKY